MAQTEEDVDRGEEGPEEGEDGEEEGQRGGALRPTSLILGGEEEAGGLLLKPGAGVKSMGWISCTCSGG